MTRTAPPPEPFCHRDFRNLGDALLLALHLLANHGNQAEVDMVTDVAEGRKRVELRSE